MQRLPTGKSGVRWFTFQVYPVLLPLVIDPRTSLTQLYVLAVFSMNIAVPLDLAIFGKLAQTGFPTEALRCRPNAFQDGFEVDSFSECLFADPSFWFVFFDSEFRGCDATAATAIAS